MKRTITLELDIDVKAGDMEDVIETAILDLLENVIQRSRGNSASLQGASCEVTNPSVFRNRDESKREMVRGKVKGSITLETQGTTMLKNGKVLLKEK
jgi:hypothetical protein